MLKYYFECLQQDWVICVCYLVQGAILTLPDVALRLFLSENLSLSPSQVQLIYAFMLIPWLCKPVYGFISDTFPIFGYKRLPYLILSQLATAACWIFLSFVGYCDQDNVIQTNLYYDQSSWITENEEIPKTEETLFFSGNMAVVFGLIGLYGESLFVCISGVIVDAIIVERVQNRELGKEQLGQLQTVCTLWRLTGTLTASIFSGLLTDHLEIYQVFLITSLLPIIAFLCVWFLEEAPVSTRKVQDEVTLVGDSDHNVTEPGRHGILQKIRENLKLVFEHLFVQSDLWKPALFILTISAVPSSYTAFYYFLYYEIEVTPTQFGVIMLLTTLAGLLGTIVYSVFLRKRNMRIVFAATILLGFLIRLTPEILISGKNEYLNIPGPFFAISDSVVISLVSQLSMMPLIVLGASVCPPGIEGTMYAFLMSLTEVGGILGDLLGTALTSWLGVTNDDFSNLWLLVLICNVIGLCPLLLLPLVPSKFQLSVVTIPLEENETVVEYEMDQIASDEEEKMEDSPI